MASYFDADESYGDEGSFEVIPPVITVSNAAPKASKSNSGPPSKRARSETKTPVFSGNFRESPSHPSKQRFSFKSPWIVIPALLLMISAASVLSGNSSSPNDIEELRLEFKRDLESLRTEVEHDLVAHLLATAEVQTAAKQRAIKKESIVEPPPLRFLASDNVAALQRLLGDRMQSMDILPSHGWNRDAIFRQLQTMHAATLSSWNSTKHKIRPKLQSICDTIAPSWDSVKEMILLQYQSYDFATIIPDWFQDAALQEIIDFANEHRLEVSAWCTALLLLLYNLYRCSSGRNTDESRNQRDNRKVSDSLSSVYDEESSDKHSRNTSHTDGDEHLDPPERIEDVLMEHMFQESVAAAANGNWPIVEPRVYTGGNRTSNERHSTARNRGGASSASRHARHPMSKEERRRRARINAREFAARDKQRLAAASSPSPHKKTKAASPSPTQSISNEEHRIRSRINAREFAARDKQRLSRVEASISSPVIDLTATAALSPYTSKRARLQQARANAKLYAEQDKQRLKQAAADSPHKRTRNL